VCLAAIACMCVVAACVLLLTESPVSAVRGMLHCTSLAELLCLAWAVLLRSMSFVLFVFFASCCIATF
jgi:hypothetical protein